MTCPTCGAAVAAGARFCSACGHPLAARGDERRVVTVLFADLVGFTSLSEARDPEQVKNFVDACFARLVPEVTAFGGQVDKIMGDAVLALFGAPVAHEDDAERAVRAALRMQETLARFCSETGTTARLRIGVNTGEVLVGSLRAGASYTAMGDVVNLAERLQKTAPPGAVVVGPATHAATREVIAYDPLGRVEVRGREGVVEAWRATEPLRPPGYRRRRLQTRLVGRDAELGVLTHALEAAFERRRTHLVVLLGEAGVGKTRLAEEAAERGRRAQQALVLEGRCVPYGEANVWWPVAEALRHACGVGPDDPLRVATSRCTEAVAAVTARPEEDPEVGRIVAGLLHLIGYEGPLHDIDPHRAREEATRSVVAFVEAACGTRPVVVVLSDLHWAGEVVLELIGVLVERLSRSRLVVIATARPTLLERWGPPAGRYNTVLLNLDPLDRSATNALLDAITVEPLPAGLRATLLDRSGGNPFFLEELVALLAEAGPGPAEEGRAPAELPDTLRGLVAARIDGLDDLERATLQDAAVWGRRGPVEALERMAEQIRGVRDLDPVLAGLVDKEVLVREGGRWEFRSDLIREVSYGTLTKADRARRHCGIAEYLEHQVPTMDEAAERVVDVIAHHYAAAAELAGELGRVEGVREDVREAALGWLEEAARRAEVAQVLPVAARLFSQAVRLGGSEPDARAVRMLLGRARADAGLRRLDRARADVDEAERLAGILDEPVLAFEARLVRGDVLAKAGDLEAAVRTFEEAAAAFAALGEDRAEAEALRSAGMTRIFLGDFDGAEHTIEQALGRYRRLGERRGEAWALQHLAWISYLEGRTDEAEARLATSAETFDALGDRGGLGWATGLLAFVRFRQGRLAEAGELGARILVEARERGDRWGEGMMLLLASGVDLWSGRTEDAVAAAREALAVFGAIDDQFGIAQASAVLGRSLVMVGRVGEGLEVLRRAEERFRGVPAASELHGSVLGALACALVQLGDPRSALAALGRLHPTDPADRGLGAVDRVVAEGLAHAQEGRLEQALAVLAPAARGDGRGGNPFARSAHGLVLAAAGRSEVAAVEARAVEADPAASYSDRAFSRIGSALGRAAAGDEGSLEELGDVVAEVDATGDVLTGAVARLAEATALEALGLPSAGLAVATTDRELDALGVELAGWRALFRLAVGAGSVTASRPAGS